MKKRSQKELFFEAQGRLDDELHPVWGQLGPNLASEIGPRGSQQPPVFSPNQENDLFYSSKTASGFLAQSGKLLILKFLNSLRFSGPIRKMTYAKVPKQPPVFWPNRENYLF